MRFRLLLFCLAAGIAVQAQQKQSLKELLFSGKLKKDTTGVVRSTDDLADKIDTSTKKEVPPTPVKETSATADLQSKAAPSTEASPSVAQATAPAAPTDASTAATPTAPAEHAPAKSNTKIWKEYTDSLVKDLQGNALKSRQIKKDTYFVTIDYEIGTDGQVTVSGVSSSPDNAFLKAQVNQMLEANPIHLTPVMDSNNQPHKVKKRQVFSVTKD